MDTIKIDDRWAGFRDALAGRESSYDLRVCAESPSAEPYQDGMNIVEAVKARRNTVNSEPLERFAIDMPAELQRKIEIVAARYNLKPSEYMSCVMDLAYLQTFGKEGPK